MKLSSSDLPGLGQGGAAMTKATNGVWETTIDNPKAGSWRYNFNVDGLSVIDPRNPLTSESNENTWSLVHVKGDEWMDTREVPHGAVAEVTYYSSVLKRHRRMHVYTPPGYENGEGKFPLFYLLHGAFDSDNSWSTVGRAGFIIDNLIADKKAKPMIIVMSHGHTGPFRMGAGGLFGEDFEKEFVTDIMPQIEKNYRVLGDRKNRAIAGLSMGGAQTLNISISKLDQFAYIGVYSSGVFGMGNPNASGPSWEDKNKAALDDPKLKEGLKLFWFATGKEDFLLRTTQSTVEMLKKHKFDVTYKETDGGHTWIKWREYLNEFAPQLFQ